MARLRSVLCTAAALIDFSAGCATSPEPSFVFLHVVPTELVGNIGKASPSRVRLEMREPELLLPLLRDDAVLELEPESLLVDVHDYPGRREGDPMAYLAPSFLVDYDEPAVKELLAELRELRGAEPTVEDVVAYTRGVIEGSSARGFDVASVVAIRRKGDCTEHAVLFAALARGSAWPTRIALGTVILESHGEVGAFGHAWTEVWDGTAWRLVDPTDIEGAAPVVYIPTGFLDDEGPGFLLGVLRSAVPGISRVSVIVGDP
jgi:transglutaminase-like putative cysteine protease